MHRLVPLGLFAAAVAQAVPTTLVHQGRLLDGTGTPVNGTATLHVAIYVPPPWDGNEWEDTFTDVPIHNGYYAVVLGSGEPLNPNTFDYPVDEELVVTWVGVGEVARETVGSVPNAFVADHADLATSLKGPVQLQGELGATGCASSSDVGKLRTQNLGNSQYELQYCRPITGAVNLWEWWPSGGPRVAFSARGATSTATSQSPVVFGTEEFDRITGSAAFPGSGYDPSTGVFCCPYSGIYAFSYNIVHGNGTTSGNYTWARLEVKGASGGWTNANGNDPAYNVFSNVGDNSYVVSNATQMVELLRGWQVRVSCGAHSSVNATLYPPSSFFNGTIVTAY